MISSLSYEALVGLLVMLGTAGLLTEVLVRARGLAASFGIILMALYFYYYVPEPSYFIGIFIAYVIGIFLIVIDGKWIGDGILSILGVLTILVSVALAAPTLLCRLFAILGVIFGIVLALFSLKLLPKRKLWERLTLKDRLTTEKGYHTLREEIVQLKGKEGITVTDLRPSGYVRIQGEDYSVVSEGDWLSKGTKVVVIKIDGTKIVVKPLQE